MNRDRLLSVSGLADDHEIRVRRQQDAKALAKQCLIVGEHDADRHRERCYRVEIR
jgi:hypothetical protein